MLQIRNITKTFHPGTPDERQALRGISLEVNTGDFITIIGANGAGKSTLFNAISGTFPIDGGHILLDGRDITWMPAHQRSRVIGQLFQDPMRGSAPHMSIGENLALASGKGGWLSAVRKRDREEFRALALASTELRLPLNNVLSLTEQLLAEAEGETKDKASRMNRSLYQMLRILGNMSDAGQLSAGYRPSLHNIPVVIGEIFGKAQALIPHAGITLTYKGLDELVLGLADADQLERAIFNILSNAMKFTPAGGTLSAELVRSGKLLRLTIQDSGSGIARKVMDTLFCRYLREPGIEDSRHGLGLGMPLIRAVAANHGGTVLIDRFAENGTRITMTITIRQTEGDTLRSPWKRPDYAGERNHALVELSDCLPAGLYGGTE